MKKVSLSFIAACCIALSFMSCEPINKPTDGPFDVNGGMSTGVFTVGEGKTVQFSRGNLQYCPSTKKWRFADAQYTYVGEENTNVVNANYTGWVDLFGWGTGTCPLSLNTDPTSYSTFNEWGANEIYSGDMSVSNYWRTLSDDEWMYLLHQRKNAKSLRGKATIRGNERDAHGLVIWPDGSKVKKFNFNTKGENWNDNEIETDAWYTMQNNGAVFIPAAGYYTISPNAGEAPDLHSVDNNGYYWTKTEGAFNGNSVSTAYYMNFGFNFVSSRGDISDTNNTADKNRGFAVRLVRDK